MAKKVTVVTVFVVMALVAGYTFLGAGVGPSEENIHMPRPPSAAEEKAAASIVAIMNKASAKSAAADKHEREARASEAAEKAGIAAAIAKIDSINAAKKVADEAATFEYSATTTDTPRFYPTYLPGQLCHSKTIFDSWEESHGTLKECCEAFFSWDYEACCSSLDMGGCE